MPIVRIRNNATDQDKTHWNKKLKKGFTSISGIELEINSEIEKTNETLVIRSINLLLMSENNADNKITRAHKATIEIEIPTNIVTLASHPNFKKRYETGKLHKIIKPTTI